MRQLVCERSRLCLIRTPRVTASTTTADETSSSAMALCEICGNCVNAGV